MSAVQPYVHGAIIHKQVSHWHWNPVEAWNLLQCKFSSSTFSSLPSHDK